MATFAEPFAAAYHSLDIEAPKEGEKVVVVGVGKLGLLLITSLIIYKRKTGINFEIHAISRKERSSKICNHLGEGKIKIFEEIDKKSEYEIVYDTSGSITSLQRSMLLSKRSVHLKSTNGEVFEGIKHLTQFVVDEMTLSFYDSKLLDSFRWNHENQDRKPRFVFLSPSIASSFHSSLTSSFPSCSFVKMDPVDCFHQLLSKDFQWDPSSNFGIESFFFWILFSKKKKKENLMLQFCLLCKKLILF